ncbi:MAG: hypothetical protein R8J85_07410 [Mariprofundales bacterium]
MKLFVFFIVFCAVPLAAQATPTQAWQQALQQGDAAQSALMLQGAATVLREGDPWRSRMLVAAELYAMRAHQVVRPAQPLIGNHGVLATGWLQQHPAPNPEKIWLVATVATVLPGAGHLLLHRWRDALVVLVLVWPMIGLTLWAARREMGPVTLFFTLITTWLWSGTVFSAVSLAKRGGLEHYEQWWRALWQASGLPGTP